MSSEPSTQLKPTSAVAGGIAADLADPVSPLSTPDKARGRRCWSVRKPRSRPTVPTMATPTGSRHYVSRDRIAESKLTGRPVVALCGKIWVPKHDPSQYPVCPDCKRIYEEMMK